MTRSSAATKSNHLQPVPSRLFTPPASVVKPPTSTQAQELPFKELRWEDFERLCLRLARLEADVEHCQLYGVLGQEQKGIDLYARKQGNNKYTTYQCKRVDNFTPFKIKQAVNKFMAGEWADRSDTFVLCTSESMVPTERAEEIENQRTHLSGIAFVTWDSVTLSIMLKDQPRLVDDFFGRQWVSEFCGPEIADSLIRRLDTKAVTELRRQLGVFYRGLFITQDPGLPIAPSANISPLPIDQRFVIPDVYDQRSIVSRRPKTDADVSGSDPIHPAATSENTHDERRRRTAIPQPTQLDVEQRLSVETWLLADSWNVLFGAAGSGKSTLLRYVALDILNESPKLEALAAKWGLYLPIWIPFALWTSYIAKEGETTCSLPELMRRWLTSFAEEELLPIVEKALEDERLLLLVDGVDEWTTETAAGIAFDRLKVFVEGRNIPVVLTSRPTARHIFATQTANWQRAELSELSSIQQQRLAEIWFTHWAQVTHPDQGITDRSQQAEREADIFLQELHKTPALRELGENPLLLCAFIALRLQNIVLPETRFKAYAALTELLIKTHPSRRKRAATVTDQSFDLNSDDLLRVLACLAYIIQEQSAANAVGEETARKIVGDYLRDEENGLGLNVRETRQYTNEILNIGEVTTGLLVHRSPQEIGFFHRAFQEYLASQYMVRLPVAQQIEIVKQRCVDLQWRDVLLSLFQTTNRPEDIATFVEQIKTISPSVSQQLIVDQLLAEIAFGAFNCPLPLAKRLATETLDKIETESWLPQRERLLTITLSGLRSASMKEMVKEKLCGWFPCRSQWLSSLYNAMHTWTPDSHVIACLLRAVRDAVDPDQLAAAQTLAQLMRGDYDVAMSLTRIVRSDVGAQNRAAALQALLIGWSESVQLDELVDAAAASSNAELRLMGIRGRILKKRHTHMDWEKLTWLIRRGSHLSYYWRDDLANALMEGWPHSLETKEFCRDVLTGNRQHQYPLQDFPSELALKILLLDYGGDPDVEQYCLNEIQHRQTPFPGLGSGIDMWRWLLHGFRDNPALTQALDEWMPKQEHWVAQVSIAALIGRTPIGKAKLLNMLGCSVPHWPTEALLTGWGMEDAEVAERLLRIAYGPANAASRIGSYLPQIIEDKKECRRRLLELLRDPGSIRPNTILSAFEQLGNTQGDTEVVDIAMNSVLQRKVWLPDHESFRQSLIVNYSSDPRIRELAKQELAEREGVLNAVAMAYGNEEEFRQALLGMAGPLPVPLRLMIARHFEHETREHEFVLSLLSAYDSDPDPNVKTQTAIDYYERLSMSNENIQPVLDRLNSDLVSGGWDGDARRQAAFCGFIAIDKLDASLATRDPYATTGSRFPLLFTDRPPNMAFVQYFLRHWQQVKTVFGEELWTRIAGQHGMLHTWETLSLIADEYPDACNELLELLDITEPPLSTDFLRFLGRARPKSRLLLKHCLSALQLEPSMGTYSFRDKHDAADLLAINFGGDQMVLQSIMTEVERGRIHSDIVMALCAGWPESAEWKRVYQICKDQNLQVHRYAGFQVIALMAETDRVMKLIDDVLAEAIELTGYDHPRLIQPVIQRVHKDDELANRLRERLLTHPMPNEKASIPRLLAAAGGLTDEIKNWCANEINRQRDPAFFAEIGLDVITGDLRPVALCLLDVL